MPLEQSDLDHAVERLSHRVAHCVHYMLADSNTTVTELKAAIAAFPKGTRDTTPEMIDAMLTATRPEIITCSALADVAFVLKFDWDFKIIKLPQPTEAEAALS